MQFSLISIDLVIIIVFLSMEGIIELMNAICLCLRNSLDPSSHQVYNTTKNTFKLYETRDAYKILSIIIVIIFHFIQWY